MTKQTKALTTTSSALYCLRFLHQVNKLKKKILIMCSHYTWVTQIFCKVLYVNHYGWSLFLNCLDWELPRRHTLDVSVTNDKRYMLSTGGPILWAGALNLIRRDKENCFRLLELYSTASYSAEKWACSLTLLLHRLRPLLSSLLTRWNGLFPETKRKNKSPQY